MNNRKIFTSGFLGVILIAVGFTVTGCGPDKNDEITATGTIEMTEVLVSSKVSGRVLKMNFEEGQLVSEKDLMAEFDHDQVSAQITAARSSLEAAKAGLKAALRDLKRVRQLYRAELISQADYDRTVTNQEVFDAQVKQAEANLKLLEVQDKETRIFAPAQGEISAKLAEPGEIVMSGAVLYTILDYTKPWVKIYLPLLEVERIKLNQPAIVALDAFSGLKFKGRISYIAPKAEFTPKDYLSKEERVKQVYEVKVELDNTSGKLKAGIPAEVRIANEDS